MDEAVADSYGRLAARIVELSRQPPARVMDLLIAATAHTDGAIVFTRNADGTSPRRHVPVGPSGRPPRRGVRVTIRPTATIRPFLGIDKGG